MHTFRLLPPGPLLASLLLLPAALLLPACEPTCEPLQDGRWSVQTVWPYGDDLLDRVQLYGRLLAVPARVAYDEKRVLQGKQLFHDAGCAGCHTPRHTTGDSDLPELAYQTIWPYTDLLLHDMGPELSDERPVFDAAGAEWRTPPLWGIGRYPDVNGHQQLLHDGRARGVAEAILWHGGEAAASREAFKGSSREERDALVTFVESL